MPRVEYLTTIILHEEDDMAARRWQDWVNLVLGLWLFASPWVLGYADTTAAWNAYALGAAIVVFAAIAANAPHAWEEVVNALLGVWLVISPFVLGFSDARTVTYHTIIMGLLVAGFAVWAALVDQDVQKYWHRHPSV